MKKILYSTALTILLSALFLIMPERAFAQDINWGGWTLDYQVSGTYEGMELSNVSYQGQAVFNKASLPVMTVFYENDACGPYADRLGGAGLPVDWAGGNSIVNRTFTLNGEQWLELGFQDQIGQYILYQVWYLSANGEIDGHAFAKGLQCIIDHDHFPYWRLDFDLSGSGNDQIRRFTNSGWQVMTTEFEQPATTAVNHQWQVRDTNTGMSVDIAFDNNQWNVPGTVIPETQYNQNNVFGRRYNSSENSGWTYGARGSVPGGNSENINSQDIVLWYQGYLPHLASEGSALWHSTGIRMKVNLPGGGTNPTPTPLPPSSDQNGVESVTLAGTSSGNYNLGYEFTTSNAIIVSALGLFDHNGDGTLSSGSTAAIWTQSGSLLASVSLAQNSPAVDGKFFASMSPLTLQPGTYIVAATHVSGGEPYGWAGSSSITPGNGITIGNGRWSSGSSLAYPSNVVSGSRYFGGNFKYSLASGGNPTPTPTPVAPTPTPSSPTPTPTNTPVVSQGTISVSNMVGSATTGRRGRWNASVTVTVVNQSGSPIGGVAVSGRWSSGGSGSCTTTTSGQCTVSKNNLKSRVTSTTFSISSLELTGYTYQPSSNVISSTTVSQP